MRPTRIILLGICFVVLLSSCSQQRSQPVSQTQLQQFAAGCNAGFAASCIILQQGFEENRAAIFYDQNAAIATEQHWQNYWLAQQRASDQIYNDATNQINFTRSQLVH